MKAVLDILCETYDGVEGHLKLECALSDDDIAIIKGNILVKRTDS